MTTKKQKPKYNKFEFNAYIKPFLSKGRRGRKPKISYYKIFNYILYVLHTGMQWNQLKTTNNEIYWTNIYKHHNRWSKDGSYRRVFENSVEVLDSLGKLDLATLYGDGNNVVAKKGEKKSDIPDTNIRKAKKCLL